MAVYNEMLSLNKSHLIFEENGKSAHFDRHFPPEAHQKGSF